MNNVLTIIHFFLFKMYLGRYRIDYLALTQDLFKYAGELMAISIIQGGPAPNFLSPVIFDVIAKGLSKAVYSLDMIEEPNLREIAAQVHYLMIEHEVVIF